MARNPSEVEQAVSRTLRDSLAKLQQTSGELNQAVNDLVSACASARPSNSLPPMLRARSAAASLAASLEVLSKFVINSLQSGSAPVEEEESLAAAPRVATPVPPGKAIEPVEAALPVVPNVSVDAAAPVEEQIESVAPVVPVAVAAPIEEQIEPVAAIQSVVPVEDEAIEPVAPIAPVVASVPVEEQIEPVAAIEPVAPVPVDEVEPVAPIELIAAAAPIEQIEPAVPIELVAPVAPVAPPVMPLAEVAPPPAASKAPKPMPESEWAELLEPVASVAQEELRPAPAHSANDNPSAPFPASYNDVLPPEAVGFDVLSLAPEQQELHRRANRVAKVSMQDVKMLRPVDVALGREHKDLCIRLRDDIEKAHREYDRRFHAIMDQPVDYFYDWMVEILGGGDPRTLGEYPYPTPVLRR